MKKKDINKLPLGLYIVYWKEGGHSLASMGQYEDGERWFAPSNWVNGSVQLNGYWRSQIKAMIQIINTGVEEAPAPAKPLIEIVEAERPE